MIKIITKHFIIKLYKIIKMKFDEKIQLIIVGESSVGKTSIVNK